MFGSGGHGFGGSMAEGSFVVFVGAAGAAAMRTLAPSSRPTPPPVITFSPASRPFTTWTLSGSRAPELDFLLVRGGVRAHHHHLHAAFVGWQQRGGGNDNRIGELFRPGSRRGPWRRASVSRRDYSASTQTSTVVLFGSTAGLTTVTLPFDLDAGFGLRDRRPYRRPSKMRAWATGTLARAITRDTSTDGEQRASRGGHFAGDTADDRQ